MSWSFGPWCTSSCQKSLATSKTSKNGSRTLSVNRSTRISLSTYVLSRSSNLSCVLSSYVGWKEMLKSNYLKRLSTLFSVIWAEDRDSSMMSTSTKTKLNQFWLILTFSALWEFWCSSERFVITLTYLKQGQSRVLSLYLRKIEFSIKFHLS